MEVPTTKEATTGRPTSIRLTVMNDYQCNITIMVAIKSFHIHLTSIPIMASNWACDNHPPNDLFRSLTQNSKDIREEEKLVINLGKAMDHLLRARFSMMLCSRRRVLSSLVKLCRDQTMALVGYVKAALNEQTCVH